MEVNICHRLIKDMVKNGVKFLKPYQFINNYGVITENIPKGVYATREYKIGETIKKLEGTIILKPTKESIHIGNGMHIIDYYGQFINHSLEPNVRIELNNIIAIEEIKPFDEITFNYNETEINMSN